MNKSKNFTGQPIIKQVLKFINSRDIHRTAQKHNSDRYTKKFTTYDHLVTMMFSVMSGCSSLREVTSIMLACEGKINHLNLNDFPKRSLCPMPINDETPKYLQTSISFFISDTINFYRTAEPGNRQSKD